MSIVNRIFFFLNFRKLIWWLQSLSIIFVSIHCEQHRSYQRLPGYQSVHGMIGLLVS